MTWTMTTTLTRGYEVYREAPVQDGGRMTRKESVVYKQAYEQAVREHPKGGGLLGATARLFCAQTAGDEAVRKLRKSRRGQR
jgi:hypothetical protein